MKIDNVMTHVSHAEDIHFLRKQLFDVNMRLYRVNRAYRQVVNQCCKAMTEAALVGFEDYKPLHGISGANLAIPFNIIGIIRNRGSKKPTCEIMINPKITRYSAPFVECESNCGSIRLKKPIIVKRPSIIDLEYFDILGFPIKLFGVNREEGSLTIQHEVDHNRGVLITDIANR